MDKTPTNTKKVFFSGVLLLTLSAFLVKLIGLVYKIPMLSYLGSEGMGYFHAAYEIYALFCIIATAGLPVALSVLISEAVAKGRAGDTERIYRAAFLVFLLLGVIGTLVMWLGADVFCNLIKSENARSCIVSIAPTVLCVCVSSAIRGYFQGYQRMLPTALSQLIEAVGKLVFGLAFAHLALERGADTQTVAAAAGWGLTLGTMVSMLYLFFEKARVRYCARRKDTDSFQKDVVPIASVWKHLGRLAIPMTLGASLVSLTKIVDMAMILRRLQVIGYSEALANEAYGSYTTLALSVYGVLPTLLNSVFLPLVPMLSAAIASGDREQQAHMVESAYRLTAAFAIPASLGIAAFSRPVLSLLFRGEGEAVATAAPLLSVLGASVFLSCMISASNSVLHAYRIVNRPILSLIAGAAVKIPVAYLLIGIPSVGLMGAPVSTLACNLVVVVLNLAFASKQCGGVSVRDVFVRPLWLSTLAVGVPFGLYLFFLNRFGENDVMALPFILLAVVLYAVLGLVGEVLTREDIAALPFGEQICTLLTRFHLLTRQKK